LSRFSRSTTSIRPRVMGTPHYMAPEQIFGASDVDSRADVWALGVLTYEVLSG
jgi:serine/threonine-protein kinase